MVLNCGSIAGLRVSPNSRSSQLVIAMSAYINKAINDMNGNVVVPARGGGSEPGSVSEVGCSLRRAAQVKYSNEYLSDTSSEVSEGFVRNYGHYDTYGPL